VNERIKELAEQATTIVDTVNSQGYSSSYANFDREKFAELIVRDIFNVMNDQKTYNRCTYTTHDLDKAKCVVKEVIICVNEHFGTKL
jgi:hypothetical protein